MPDPLVVLPPEMVLNVFDHLPNRCVWQLRTVSRLWNQTLSDARCEVLATNGFEHVDPSDLKARIALLKTHHAGMPAARLHRTGVNRSAFTVHNHQVRYPALVGHFTAYSLSNGTIKIHNLETGGEWTKDANTSYAPKLSLTNRIVAFIGQEYPDGPQVLFWSKLHDLDQPMQQWHPTMTLNGLARDGTCIALITNSHEISLVVHDNDEDYISSLLKRRERRTVVTVLIYDISSFNEPKHSFEWKYPISYVEPMIVLERDFITVMALSQRGYGLLTRRLDSHTFVFKEGTHIPETKCKKIDSDMMGRRRPRLIAPHIHKIGDSMHYNIKFFDEQGHIEDLIIKAGPQGVKLVGSGLLGPRRALWRDRHYHLEGNSDRVEAEIAVELYVERHQLGAHNALRGSFGIMLTAKSFGLHMRFCLANDWYLVALGPACRNVRDEVQVLTFLKTGLQLGPAVTVDPIRGLGRGHWGLTSVIGA